MPRITGKLGQTTVTSTGTWSILYTCPAGHISSGILYADPWGATTGNATFRVIIIQGTDTSSLTGDEDIIYDMVRAVDTVAIIDKIPLGPNQSIAVYSSALDTNVKCAFSYYGEQAVSPIKVGILGQDHNLTSAGIVTLYTCPTNKKAVGTFYAVNHHATYTSNETRIYINSPRFGDSPSDFTKGLLYSGNIAPGQRIVLPNIYLGDGESIRIDDGYSTTVDSMALGFYGVEEET